MEAFQPESGALKQFLEEFSKTSCKEIGCDDELPHRIVSNFITEHELEAEIIDWVLSYLTTHTTHKAPHLLACLLARETVNHALQWDIKTYLHNPVPTSSQQTGDDDDDDATDILDDNEVTSDKTLLIDVYKLARDVFNKLHEIIKMWAQKAPAHFAKLPGQAPYCGISVSAIRNGRRKMEDKHVILPYLAQLYPHLQAESTHQCFAAVYDGHGGTEAACYTSAHLHHHVINHPAFKRDPIIAIKEAYKLTDSAFSNKCRRERIRSGATAVTALLRDNKLYVSWLGDSQVLLVKNGRPVELMKPHKPEREDERQRIEDAGGFVVMIGTWRVNAVLSVSRAIGDTDFKPIVSGEPDLDTVDLIGDEDYVILACDGLWDTLSYDEVVTETHNYLKLSTGSKANLASYLSQRAKEKGSTDNISVVVVFLRDEIAVPKLEEMVAPLVSEEDDQVEGSQGRDSDSRDGTGNSNQQQQTKEGFTNSQGAKNSQQKDSDLYKSSQLKSGLQSRINLPLIQSGNVLQRIEFKSCQAGKGSNIHIIEGDRLVDFKYYPKQVGYKAAIDDLPAKTSCITTPKQSPVIPEHFVKAFEYARKFPTQSRRLCHISQDCPNTPSTRSVTFANENQENQSPNISVASKSNTKSSATPVAQKIYLESDNCSDTSITELKLVTETGNKCLHARKSKSKRINRSKPNTEDVRRVSRDRLSLGIAERTKLSSNSSSASPYSDVGVRKSNIDGFYERNIMANNDAQFLLLHSDISPICRSNWTVAVEIENAAAMFGE